MEGAVGVPLGPQQFFLYGPYGPAQPGRMEVLARQEVGDGRTRRVDGAAEQLVHQTGMLQHQVRASCVRPHYGNRFRGMGKTERERDVSRAPVDVAQARVLTLDPSGRRPPRHGDVHVRVRVAGPGPGAGPDALVPRYHGSTPSGGQAASPGLPPAPGPGTRGSAVGVTWPLLLASGRARPPGTTPAPQASAPVTSPFLCGYEDATISDFTDVSIRVIADDEVIAIGAPTVPV